MNTLDTQYRNILSQIMLDGEWDGNRTGVDTKTIPAAMISHNMSEGFPLLTLKRVPFRVMAVELEGFIKGITSKAWFQERNCHIWDAWCNPQKVPYGHDSDTRRKMLEEDDLGVIYGWVWRNWSKNIIVDQLQNIVDTLKSKPQDRRMICSSWNPTLLQEQALPPCHVLWQVSVVGGKLNLTWFQRSCDYMLGIPFNIASYGLLLHLLAQETGLKEGTLTGFLNNVHIYENQLDGAMEMLLREPYFSLPIVETSNFTSIYNWQFTDTMILDYQCLPTIKMPVTV